MLTLLLDDIEDDDADDDEDEADPTFGTVVAVSRGRTAGLSCGKECWEGGAGGGAAAEAAEAPEVRSPLFFGQKMAFNMKRIQTLSHFLLRENHTCCCCWSCCCWCLRGIIRGGSPLVPLAAAAAEAEAEAEGDPPSSLAMGPGEGEGEEEEEEAATAAATEEATRSRAATVRVTGEGGDAPEGATDAGVGDFLDI